MDLNVLKNTPKPQPIILKSKYWCKTLPKVNQSTLQNLLHIGPTLYKPSRDKSSRGPPVQAVPVSQDDRVYTELIL
jgi:hypothetical protein